MLQSNSVCPSDPARLRGWNWESIAKPIDVPERARLLVQDAPAKHIYFIAEGVVRLATTLSDGQRQILGFGLPGNLVGFQIGDRYNFSVEAVTPTKAYQLLRSGLLDLMNQKLHLAPSLLELFAQELTFIQNQIAIFGYRASEQRVAFFLRSLRERWSRIIGPEKPVPMPMTRQDIADFLGLRLETVSRTISRMSREKVIDLQSGQFRIVDDARIGRLLSGGWPKASGNGRRAATRL